VAVAVALLAALSLVAVSVALEASLPRLHLPVPVAHALAVRLREPTAAERRRWVAARAWHKARADLRSYLARRTVRRETFGEARAAAHGIRLADAGRPRFGDLATVGASRALALKPYDSLAIGFFVDWDPASFTSLQENLQRLSVLMPEWLALSGSDGTFAQDDPATEASTLAYLRTHRPGVPVVPLVNNYWRGGFDGPLLGAMLANPHARARAVAGLLRFVTDEGLAGINVDFENVPPGSQRALRMFMAQLHARFQAHRLSVSMDVPLDDFSYNCHALARTVDYFILMGYDQHAPGTQAGPIAAQGWLMRNFRRRLEQAPASKYVIGIGGYGYDWTGRSTNATACSYGGALSTARNAGAQIRLDPASLNPTFSYVDAAGAVHHVWFLDGVSAWDEIVQTRPYRPCGYALWRLGSEDQSAWAALQARDDPTADPRRILGQIACGTDVNSVGQGQILQVTSARPTPGIRLLSYSPATGLIGQERIARYPNGYVLMHWGAAVGHKLVALTLDDGPSVTYTPQVLRILGHYHIPATFFIIGSNGVLHPDIVREIVAAGDEIGNHTFTHPDVSKIPTLQLLLELNATQRFFQSTVGRSSLLFRPPYGSDTEPTTPAQIAPIATATRLGYYTIGMDVDPNDWSNPGTQTIVDRVLSQVAAGGDVILLHDGGGNRSETVAALPSIISDLRSRGYRFVRVSALMGVPMSAVNPPVTDATFAEATGVGFDLLTGLGDGVPRLFVVGLTMGIVWLSVLVALALIGWVKASRQTFPTGYKPSVAVVVPAFNEARVIEGTIASLLACRYPDLEILVIDDGSDDATGERARAAAAGDPRVRILDKPNAGKWSALNFAISRCSAEIVVALDADTLLQADAIGLLVRHFADPGVAAVAGNAKVGNRNNLLTRLQALEYITSQNLDRRAFSLLNCVTVVPGSVGAWRRTAVLEVGGYSPDTLAEDADLTIALLRHGFRITYEARALAFTEAPETIAAFSRQRQRWVFGTIQCYWKHRAATLHKPRSLGLLALPQALVFKVIFPLLCPAMDALVLYAVSLLAWQHFTDPGARSSAGAVLLLFYTGLLLGVDYLAAAVALLLEPGEDRRLLPLLFLQRFFYRQILSWAVYKAVLRAMRGELAQWGKLTRRGALSDAMLAVARGEQAPNSRGRTWTGGQVRPTSG
jgi:cellulose synthase/poly-beta-1,6-N-acetylglucosamine synthase-like glycosyltransferase/peptidoglycan/xylan/chitin deacetylase (PgdA/CDA1 family)/spore germination protein YaaH